MPRIKKFLKWLFSTDDPPKKKTTKLTEKGRVIKCYDCGKYGFLATPEYGYHQITDGWKIVWVGLKPIFICDRCQENRRKWAREHFTIK